MYRGLFYQLGAASPARFEALRDEVALAEALGLDAVWCLPMAGDDGGWQGSAPEIWLAGLAGSTERIRLGWGVPGVWPPREPPVREAEQGASLDVASGGRLDVALLPDAGTGVELVEYAELGVPATVEPACDEGVRMWVDMWAPATFSWTSARFSVPPIDVVPKPVQQPHPPLWLLGWSPAHAAEAGLLGLGFLDVCGGGAEIWSAHRECYAAARSEAKPDDLVCASTYAVATDPSEAGETGLAAMGRGGRSSRDWLEELSAIGIDHVVLRAGPLEGGHEETCRRIRWFARS